MRHSLWDLKRELESVKEQSRRWNIRCAASQMDWNVNSEAEPQPPGVTPPPPPRRATPSPIDYRSESRRRHDHQDGTVPQSSSSTSHDPQGSLMGPPSAHFTGSWSLMPPPDAYAEAGQSHHSYPPYSAQHRWGQTHPGYFQSTRGQYSFDMKWWAQQKQSMDAYLGGPSWNDDGKGPHPNSSIPQWSFGTRVMKSTPRRPYSRIGPRTHADMYAEHDYELNEPQHPRSPSHRNRDGGGYLSHHRQHANFSPSRHPATSHHHLPRGREVPYDPKRRFPGERKDYRRPTLTPLNMKDFWGIGNSSNNNNNNKAGVSGKAGTGKEGKKGKVKGQLNRANVPGSFRSLSVGGSSKSIRPASTNGAMGQSRIGLAADFSAFRSKNKGKAGKSGKGDESATLAEAAKKKALAAAANKLRRTFLAAKKKNRGGGSSQAEDEEEGGEDGEETTDNNNAQDLTMPRRHPSSCVEFDIDIRFSAKEWAAIGRGQGGSSNALDLPQMPTSHRKRHNGTSKNGNLARERSTTSREDQEDSGTYSDTDISRAEPQWSSAPEAHQVSSTSTRRRHLSESSGVIDLRKNPSNGHTVSRPNTSRTRSCSLSLVEGTGGGNEAGRDGQGESRSSRMKIHLMPRLRRLMLKQLLTMDKKSLQELVDDPRSRKAQYMMTHLMTEHRSALSQRLSQQRFRSDTHHQDSSELSLLNSFDSTQTHSLPPDVIQQVREILALEEHGGSGWDEVTLSLSDLLVAPDDPDLDCQIISPPPRDPTSTITIHDSDSEMEDDDDDEEEGPDRDTGTDIEDEDNDDNDDDDEDNEDRLEEQQQNQQQDEEVEVECREDENSESLRKVESPSPSPPPSSTKPPTAPGPLPLLSQLPVEVPMCVMDTLAGPATTRDLPTQVTDATLSLITSAVPQPPPPPPMSTQRPTDTIPVPGPSSLILTPTRLKVKEERPSPVSECGLCMHPPRTPHTSECVFPYGLTPPAPVALVTGPPRPLRTPPPQRPVPHIPPPPPGQQQPTVPPLTPSSSIKQEKLDESYLKYEHVKRPSSEERPKNPAPPDALALHAPAPGLHPPPQPRPLIFSPDHDFPDPPRPPPPPPPQFSPRIKVERHTPVQFMCCCMRNECERSSGHSAEMRPPSHRAPATPQPPDRRPTPASHLYKMEPPSPSGHVRTPHFPAPISPRSGIPLHPAPAPGVVEGRVSVGVQTDLPPRILPQDPGHSNRRQYVPNLSLARSVTHMVTTKADQSTSTHDLPQEPQSRGKGRGKGWWWHRSGRPRNHMGQLASISASVREVELSGEAGVAVQQLVVLGEQEAELLRHADRLHRELTRMLREKTRVADDLARLHQLRATKLQQLLHHPDPRPHPHDSSQREAGDGSGETGCVQSTTDTSVVSSSQEKTGRPRCLSLSHASSTDSSTEGTSSVRRQRCTSTCPRSGQPTDNDDSYLPPQRNLSSPSRSFGTDSDTENDGAGEGSSPEGTSEARPAYQDTQKPVSRTRMNSLSSSAEGDTESETPGEKEDSDTSLILRLVPDVGEAVVDSSRPDHPDISREENSADEPLSQEGESSQPQQEMECGQEPESSQETSFDLTIDPSRSRQDYSSKHGESNQPCASSSGSSRAYHPPHSTPISQAHIPQVNLSGSSEEHDADVNVTWPETPCNLDVAGPSNQTPNNISSDQEKRTRKADTASISCLSSPSSSASSWVGSQEGPKGRSPSSEHCYSLRSRGPPRRTRQAVKSASPQTSQTASASAIPAPVRTTRKSDQTEEDDDDKKKKCKRKLRKQRVTKRKKKRVESEDRGEEESTQSDSLEGLAEKDDDEDDIKKEKQEEQEIKQDEDEEESEEEVKFIDPPPHSSAVLDMKVVRGFLLTACNDGTARCYNLVSGQIVATYTGHNDAVTCVGAIVCSDHTSGSVPSFKVVTGSADKSICVFNTQSGEIEERREVSEGIRCLDIAWKQLFIGTEGGCGARWNFKDKSVRETVQFCGQAITSLRAMTEGGRRVLLVSAKSTPLMIRDAMTGLFLRTLEYVQVTVCTTVSHGGHLYTGGSNNVVVSYEFTTGNSRGHIASESDVSCLNIHHNRLVATCYDGMVRIFSLKNGELLHKIPVAVTNKMLICSALYKNRVLVGNKKGEVVGCILPKPSE